MRSGQWGLRQGIFPVARTAGWQPPSDSASWGGTRGGGGRGGGEQGTRTVPLPEVSGGKGHLFQAPGVPEPSALLYTPLPRLQFLYVLVDELGLSLATDTSSSERAFNKTHLALLACEKSRSVL